MKNRKERVVPTISRTDITAVPTTVVANNMKSLNILIKEKVVPILIVTQGKIVLKDKEKNKNSVTIMVL